MQRTLAYALDRLRLARVSGWARLAALLGFLALGGLGLAERLAVALAGGLGPVAVGLAFFALLGLAVGLFELPFDLYATFAVEQRHGFNRQTLGGFFADRLKGLALAVLLGGPLLAALLVLMDRAGRAWWVYAWAAVTAFSVFTAWIYPTLLAPLFNAFTPLPPGELRERILGLAGKVGFPAADILVMDASRRSSHGNAYFTGLLGARRIVLFDTLVSGLPAGGIVAVLAHELGHFKLHHVRSALLRGALLTGALLYLLSLCRPLAPFYTAFGLPGASSAGALAVFGLWFGPLGFLLQPVLARLARRNELAADAFAASLAGAPALGEALLGLREKSRVMPMSHPLYSAVYHSHPPLVERLEAIGYPAAGTA